MAVYRARETERPDAAFRDPYARALAGERGEAIANAMPFFEEHAWAAIARTHLFDRLVKRLVRHGVDLIVNLAACNAERNAVDIAEDRSQVLLYARTTGGSDGFCSDGVTVPLAQELGQRTIVAGNSGQRLTMEAR